MAQAGLLQSDAGESNTKLGITAAERRKREELAKSSTAVADHDVQHEKKKKKKKKGKSKSELSAISNKIKNMSKAEKFMAYNLLLETKGISTHTSDKLHQKQKKSTDHKHKIIHENELVKFLTELREKMSSYKTESENAIEYALNLSFHLPEEIKKMVSEALTTITPIIRQNNQMSDRQFDRVFSAMKPLHTYVTDESRNKRIVFNFIHPRFENTGPKTASLMRIGYAAHSIIGMAFLYSQRNLPKNEQKEEWFTEMKKVYNKLKKTYNTIISKKRRLQESYKHKPESEIYRSNINPFLSAKAEDESTLDIAVADNLNDSRTFSLAHPFEE
jgi:hypothetical protein